MVFYWLFVQVFLERTGGDCRMEADVCRMRLFAVIVLTTVLNESLLRSWLPRLYVRASNAWTRR